MNGFTLQAWRHPRPCNADSRCIGRTNLPVDPRRARRLASRIRAFARRHCLPFIVITSPLARSLDVGRWLARSGWEHRVDTALAELDFGRWDGQPWTAIPRTEIDAWRDDLARYRPGGGESVESLVRRVREFDPGAARLVVTHGGWLSAASWISLGRGGLPDSANWPVAPRYGARVELAL